ncbi:hypothetical protein D3C81_491990 [compost metagenome]
MTLIDCNGLPREDRWQYPQPEVQGDFHAHRVVPLEQADACWAQRGDWPAAVWIGADQDTAVLPAWLGQCAVIVIGFPKSRDGRGFTLARRLRERQGFNGDLRAAGPLLPDQFSMLLQCGFTSLLASASVPPVRWQEAAHACVQARGRPRTLLERLSQRNEA